MIIFVAEAVISALGETSRIFAASEGDLRRQLWTLWHERQVFKLTLSEHDLDTQEERTLTLDDLFPVINVVEHAEIEQRTRYFRKCDEYEDTYWKWEHERMWCLDARRVNNWWTSAFDSVSQLLSMSGAHEIHERDIPESAR